MMLSLFATIALAASTPSFANDAPTGTDLLVRVETGKIWATGTEMMDELAPLVALWPGGRVVADKLKERIDKERTLLESQTQLDLSRKDAVVTLAVDLDAIGGAVWGAIARGAGKSKRATPEGNDTIEAFAIDGESATRLKTFDLTWHVRADGTVLLGSERGLQRQLRNTLKPDIDAKSEVVILARRIRKPGAITVIFAAPRPLRQAAAKTLATIGPLVRELKAMALTTNGAALELTLIADSDKGHEAVERGARALVALLRASSSLVEAGAQVILGLDRLSKWPEIVPKEIDTDDIKSLSAKWVEGFTLGASYRKRPGREVEVTLIPSSARGLVAATVLLAGYVIPRPTSGSELEARVMLMALRQLELVYREKTGAFLACGPVPAELPRGAVDWPADSCFTPLGFKPPGKVRFQIEVTAEDGNLLLVARGDPAADGVPEAWTLDETSPMIRRLADEPDDADDSGDEKAKE
jgi:hypothetical protein